MMASTSLLTATQTTYNKCARFNGNAGRTRYNIRRLPAKKNPSVRDCEGMVSFAKKFVVKTCVLILAVLCARAAAAQEAEFRPWEPFGPVPVDQAGAGRRGYVLPAESADVLD